MNKERPKGRRRIPGRELRVEYVGIRLTRTERLELDHLALKEKLSMSELILKLVREKANEQ
jgi:hypothetical protein